MKIEDLKINPKIKTNLTNVGYTDLTEIQEQTIEPILLKQNIFGVAQTGSGKTAAFLVPLIENITKDRRQKALIIAPTRDLADQIYDNCVKYAKFLNIKSVKLVGGSSYDMQMKFLQDGANMYICTPGRVMDLHKRGALDLAEMNYLVLDEADQMLDLGFINDIKWILNQMTNRIQTSLFTATANESIKKLVREFIPDYTFVKVKNKLDIKDMINQKIYITTLGNKLNLLLDILGDSKRTLQQCIVFTRTKNEASEVSRFLRAHKFDADAIHSDRSMPTRTRLLKNFRDGTLQILVATNVAARGIDISNLPLVINFDIPEQREIYVHRIGRTGRAGKMGEAITFCTPKQKWEIRELERIVHMRIEVVQDPKYLEKGEHEVFIDRRPRKEFGNKPFNDNKEFKPKRDHKRSFDRKDDNKHESWKQKNNRKSFEHNSRSSRDNRKSK